MDTTARLILKSVTWQAAGLITMTLIGFVFTGSFAASSSIAVVGSIAGFVSYFLHEVVWSKIYWGRCLDTSRSRLAATSEERLLELKTLGQPQPQTARPGEQFFQLSGWPVDQKRTP